MLGFDDIFAAADAVPAVLRHRPAALEGIDHRLVELEHSRHLAEKALRQLPGGNAWLMVQFDGDDQDDADAKAHAMIDDLHEATPHATVFDDPVRKEEVWQAREAGLGATAYPPGDPDTHEGWEDAAVPPDRFGDYLRDFRDLLDRYDYGSSSLYGHFGQGCVHTRIPFQLATAEGAATYRRFAYDAALLVVRYGGSLSGEHGDGQSRGELLPIMFGDRVVTAFEEVKALFDPRNRMNPGKVVHPRRLDQDLRMGPDYRPAVVDTEFAFVRDDHRFSRAASRCVGVGKCRGHESGVMCPSYRATGEEEHSTRGRARLLFEMLNGEEITDGWRSTDVRDALDLCLACKGCLSDCPVDVDMATYKAEFLSHHYRHRCGRRRTTRWAGFLCGRDWPPPRRAPSTRSRTPADSRQRSRQSAGSDQHRELPRFADERFTRWWQRQSQPPNAFPRGRVLLWPDTFTNNFEPDIARDAVTVLHDAGFAVDIPRRTACCGLTWISTGQLRTAKRVLRRTLDVLRPALRTGTPVVVLEPSCAAVFRQDLPDLLDGDDDARRLSEQTMTLAQLLRAKASDWRPPRHGGSAMVQQHCHQHAVLRYADEQHVLESSGVDVDVLDAGCCGLAGNFGFERGHYDVSVACAEDKMLPAIRDRDPETLVLADGFSCRLQIRELTDECDPRHIAQVLAAAVRQNRTTPDHHAVASQA